MSEQTITVESSPTTPVIEIERGPLVNLTSDQRAEFRRTGELPEAPKKEDSAPSDAEKDPPSEAEEAETAGDSGSPKKPQEINRKKPGAEHRKAELTAEIKELIRQRDSLKTEVSTAKQAPKVDPPTTRVEQPQPQQQYTREKPAAEAKGQDGKPKYSTYEEFVEDLADWKAEQRWAQQQRTQAQQNQARELDSKVSDARARYGEKFDEILQPTVNAIVSNQSVAPTVKAMLNDSEVLPDLMYVLGSDQGELNKFLAMPTGKQIRYVALTESLIREDAESKAKPETKAEPPAKPQTAAPKPPSEVGGRAATPGDELDAAVKANDFRRAKAEMTRRALAKLKA